MTNGPPNPTPANRITSAERERERGQFHCGTKSPSLSHSMRVSVFQADIGLGVTVSFQVKDQMWLRIFKSEVKEKN